MILSIIKIVFAIFLSGLFGFLELLITPFHRTGNLFHLLARTWAKWMVKVLGVKIEVEGLEKLDFSRSYIYVANHASLFDIPTLLAGVPDQIRIMYKRELEKIPFFGWGLKYGKTYISIDRAKGQTAMEGLDEAVRKIRSGASVLMFAEGTRSPDGSLQPFKRGAFHMAISAGVPVVPTTLVGTYDVLPKDSFRIRTGTVRIILSEPIEPPAPNGKETEVLFRDRVHSIIQRNLKGGSQ
jgi:1-acyl-sn-glycerol-3-phosphate acyltransferase